MENKKLRGFASMSKERQRELARKGGSNVPKEKRSFSQNKELASRAGRKGGANISKEKRSFSTNRELASNAGKLGGIASAQRAKEKKLNKIALLKDLIHVE